MLRFSDDVKRSKLLKAWSSGKLFIWVLYPNELQQLASHIVHPLKHRILTLHIDRLIDWLIDR
jgi:hypothetical protein